MAFQKVIELSHGRAPVGITGRGQWVYASSDGRLSALDEHPFPFMVTILELGEALKPALVRGLQAQGLDGSLAESFPSHVGVRMGLTWPTDYWQDLAVQWVEREGSESAFLPELEALATKGGTQRVRHTARRLARNATRRNAAQP